MGVMSIGTTSTCSPSKYTNTTDAAPGWASPTSTGSVAATGHAAVVDPATCQIFFRGGYSWIGQKQGR